MVIKLSILQNLYILELEIYYNEPFNKNEDLYPGDYIIVFAKNILNSYKEIDFKNFDKISEKIAYSID